MLYHASPLDLLKLGGICPSSKPTVGRRPSPYVYLGTLEYILEHYFQYAPRITYNVYSVDTNGLNLDWKLPAGQARLLGSIPASRLSLYRRIRNSVGR